MFSRMPSCSFVHHVLMTGEEGANAPEDDSLPEESLDAVAGGHGGAVVCHICGRIYMSGSTHVCDT